MGDAQGSGKKTLTRAVGDAFRTSTSRQALKFSVVNIVVALSAERVLAGDVKKEVMMCTPSVHLQTLLSTHKHAVHAHMQSSCGNKR